MNRDLPFPWWPSIDPGKKIQMQNLFFFVQAHRIFQDQLPTLNPLFLLIMIPIFNKLIYPAFEKCGRPLSPIKGRLVPGMLLFCVSFIMAALLQIPLNQKQSVYWGKTFHLKRKKKENLFDQF